MQALQRSGTAVNQNNGQTSTQFLPVHPATVHYNLRRFIVVASGSDDNRVFQRTVCRGARTFSHSALFHALHTFTHQPSERPSTEASTWTVQRTARSRAAWSRQEYCAETRSCRRLRGNALGYYHTVSLIYAAHVVKPSRTAT